MIKLRYLIKRTKSIEKIALYPGRKGSPTRTGLVVRDTDPVLQYFNGSEWIDVPTEIIEESDNTQNSSRPAGTDSINKAVEDLKQLRDNSTGNNDDDKNLKFRPIETITKDGYYSMNVKVKP